MNLPSCADEVIATVEDHAAGSPEVEVGGILVGSVANGMPEIAAALPALKAVGRSANVTFTHEVWDEILQRVDEDYQGQQIVGWYHSHPGFGIFLSEYDKFIHRNFFSSDSSVALVVDPRSGERGWFGWRGGEIALLEKTGGARQVAEPERTRATPRRGGVGIMAALVLSVMGLGLGYALRGTSSADTAVQRELSQANMRIAALEGEAVRRDSTMASLRDRGTALEEKVAALQIRLRNVDPVLADFTYEVRAGDTLSRIAGWFYGDEERYRRIVKDNPNLDADDILEIDELIKIDLAR